MSTTISTILRPAVVKGSSGFTGHFRACLDQIVRYFARRVAVANLTELDDRLLRDVGLERFQIEAAVHGRLTAADRSRLP